MLFLIFHPIILTGFNILRLSLPLIYCNKSLISFDGLKFSFTALSGVNFISTFWSHSLFPLGSDNPLYKSYIIYHYLLLSLMNLLMSLRNRQDIPLFQLPRWQIRDTPGKWWTRTSFSWFQIFSPLSVFKVLWLYPILSILMRLSHCLPGILPFPCKEEANTTCFSMTLSFGQMF